MAKANPDSAFRLYEKAVSNTSYGTYKGTWLQRMAEIQHGSGDYFGSNETALQSLKFFDQKNIKDFRNVAYDYDLLGRNYHDLGRYDEALSNHDSAIRFSDSLNILYFLNNKALDLEKKKQYKESISIYDSILSMPIKDTVLYTRILSNLAKTHWLQDKTYPVISLFHEARRIRELKKDKLGLNASYARLSDYYQETNPDSALYYAEKMYKVAKELDNADDKAEALDKLTRLSSGEKAKIYFSEYDVLTDSIHLARANASNQFADIRFKSEEARANNLLLQKDISQKKFRIILQRIILYTLLSLFALFVIIATLWYRKRKRLQQEETKNAIRESELKTSQKVHDVVANGLYGIMNELEHSKAIERDPLINKIEVLYEKSRNISYENTPIANTEDYNNQVRDLLNSFANEQTKVIVVGNQPIFWSKITDTQKHELQLVLNEIMINMKKHSQAKNVSIVFKQEKDIASIIYKDDGMGFPSGHKLGNGLNNTVNRIKSIGGDVNFGKSEKGGVSIMIALPLQSD